MLRPSRVHGDGRSKPDEWVFVKRVLDRRTVVALSGHGRGVDQTSAAANIAALIEVVAGDPGRHPWNRVPAIRLDMTAAGNSVTNRPATTPPR